MGAMGPLVLVAIVAAAQSPSAAAACDAPRDLVTLKRGDAPVVVVVTHAGKQTPVSCETRAPLAPRACLPDHDLVCASGPCRIHADKALRTIGEAFVAHLTACLGAAPTVVRGEVKRALVDLGRDVNDAGASTCAAASPAAVPYWRAFYDALDEGITHVHARARGGAVAGGDSGKESRSDRAMLFELHTYSSNDAAPAPAIILGAGRPFGTTLRATAVDDPGFARWFGAHGFREALRARFPGAEVWPRARDEVDEELFVGRHTLAHASKSIDAIQVEFSAMIRDEPELAAFQAADAVCAEFAARLAR